MKLQRIARSERIPRHEHRVRTFSRDYRLITHVGDRYTVDAAGAERLVRVVADEFNVPAPHVATNGRRRADTGQCWAPRWYVVETNGPERVAAWERHRGSDYPEHGQVRIGTTTTLRTLAHELGHHLVHHLEPLGTPGHGKVWVGRFDDAMEAIARLVRNR
ncbi:MAG: hypothetical protein ABFS21_02375 [Actinomycetota bacterium]